MKKNFVFWLLFLLIAACKKSEQLVNKLSLISPIQTTVNPCCTELKWSSDELGPFNLKVASDSGFFNLVLDTMVMDTAFLLTKINTPNTRVYWKVSLPNEADFTFFSIKNLAKDFQGNHPVNVRYRTSGLNFPNPIDTMYQSSIYLEDNFSSLWVSEKTSEIADKLPLDLPNSSADNIWYLLKTGGNLRLAIARLYFLQDSFHITVVRGGQGGQGTWDFYGKK